MRRLMRPERLRGGSQSHPRAPLHLLRRRIGQQRRDERPQFIRHDPWPRVPQELCFGSGRTCWRRPAAWNDAGVWDRLHLVLLKNCGSRRSRTGRGR